MRTRPCVLVLRRLGFHMCILDWKQVLATPAAGRVLSTDSQAWERSLDFLPRDGWMMCFQKNKNLFIWFIHAFSHSFRKQPMCKVKPGLRNLWSTQSQQLLALRPRAQQLHPKPKAPGAGPMCSRDSAAPTDKAFPHEPSARSLVSPPWEVSIQSHHASHRCTHKHSLSLHLHDTSFTG